MTLKPFFHQNSKTEYGLTLLKISSKVSGEKTIPNTYKKTEKLTYNCFFTMCPSVLLSGAHYQALFRFDSRAYSVNTAVLLLADCSFEVQYLVCNNARIGLIKPFYS